jgi:hypothetical protein
LRPAITCALTPCHLAALMWCWCRPGQINEEFKGSNGWWRRFDAF